MTDLSPKPFRATPEQWREIEELARTKPSRGTGTLVELRDRVLELHDRVRALEAAQEVTPSRAQRAPDDGNAPQTPHSIALQHVNTLRRMGILPQICGDLERAILTPMDVHPTEPVSPPGPDFTNGLRAKVAHEIVNAWQDLMTSQQEASAVFRVIADWLRQRHGSTTQFHFPLTTVADWLDAEADLP